MGKYSKLPWKPAKYEPFLILSADGDVVATIPAYVKATELVANRDLLIRAVNAHEALLAALKASLEVLLIVPRRTFRSGLDAQIIQARQAIALAEKTQCPPSHIKLITPELVHAVLCRWKASDLCIEWLSDEPLADAEKQTKRANVLCARLDADEVWRVLDNESFYGFSAADEVDWAVGMCCEPEGMQAGTVLRAETLNLTGE